MRPDKLEPRLRERLDTLGPTGRNALLTVLLIRDSEQRADVIGQMRNYGPQNRAFAELLIECEEDPALRAVLVGMLRGTERER